jgi:hypothetical protein
VVLVPSQEIGQRSREASFRKHGYKDGAHISRQPA